MRCLSLQCMAFVDFILVFLIWTEPSVAHYFFGGTVSFEPALAHSAEPGSILDPTADPSQILWKFRVRSAWNRTDGFNFCDETTVNSPVFLGEEHPFNAFFCDYCTDEDTPLGTGLYMCSSFSKEEGWTSGENVFFAYVNATDYAFIYLAGCCWIEGLLTYDDYNGLFQDRYYLLFTEFVSFGTLNSSPVTAAMPLMRLRTGCDYTIRIPVEDPDGHYTRCRPALWDFNECIDGCVGKYGLNMTFLQEHPCVLRFIPLDNIQGLHPLSLVIADFENDTSFVPLSVVTLKLVVDVVHGVGGQCTAHVAFVNPTLTDGTCIGIEPNSTFKTTIYVKEDPCSWLVDIVISAPVGIHKSNITGSSPYKQMSLSWRPEPKQYGYNIICFQASDGYAMYTEQRCITLIAGAVVPQPLLNSASFNGSDEVSFTVDSFSISFDSDIFRPTVSRNISIWKTHLFIDFAVIPLDDPQLVVAFDTSVDELVNITGANLTLLLPFDVELEPFAYYTIEIDFGAVVGKKPCSVGGGIPFPGLNNWQFRTVPSNYCGNAIVDNQEECDDGGNDDGDGCSFNCTVEFAHRCNETDSGKSVCIRNQCQDGIVFDPEEECDDGNSMDGDGCNQTCVIEVGYDCNTTLSGLSVCFVSVAF